MKEGGRKEIVLTPIEVAIDEMRTKVSDLREAINSPVPDKIGLQLKLQGGVSTQVSTQTRIQLLLRGSVALTTWLPNKKAVPFLT